MWEPVACATPDRVEVDEADPVRQFLRQTRVFAGVFAAGTIINEEYLHGAMGLPENRINCSSEQNRTVPGRDDDRKVNRH